MTDTGRSDKSPMHSGAAAATSPEDSETSSVKKGVAAVERALSILGAFDERNRSLSLSRISQITGLYKSTALRLIDSLESFGYIRRLQNGEYQLGPTLFRLGMLYQQSFDIGDYVVPVLQELTRLTEESSSFYIREGNHRLCLYRVESSHVVRDHVRQGDKLPLRQGAAGQILTAFDAGAEAARKLTDKSKLIAISMGERQADLAAIAAPVFSASGKLAGAVSVSGPRSRFTEVAIRHISAAARDQARMLTLKLGGDGSLLAAP